MVNTKAKMCLRVFQFIGVLMSRRLTIAIDIDGTLRNLMRQMDVFIEEDYPDRIDQFRSIKDNTYMSLDPLFKTRDELNKWMYEERVFNLFAQAQRLHPKVIDDLNIFAATAKQQGYDVLLASVQRDQSVTATLHWLSKWGCKIQRIHFFDTMEAKIAANYDIYIDDCPDVLSAYVGKTVVALNGPVVGKPRAIKIPYEFTKGIDCPSLDIANGKFDDLYEILGVEKILKK